MKTLITLYRRADVCKTAVKNPVGNVKPDIQNIFGAWAVSDHLASCSILDIKSLVHAAKGFNDGYI